MPAIARAGLSWNQKPQAPSRFPTLVSRTQVLETLLLPPRVHINRKLDWSGGAETQIRHSGMGGRCPNSNLPPVSSIDPRPINFKKSCLAPCSSASMTNPMNFPRHIVGVQTSVPLTQTCCSSYQKIYHPLVTQAWFHHPTKISFPLQLHNNPSLTFLKLFAKSEAIHSIP